MIRCLLFDLDHTLLPYSLSLEELEEPWLDAIATYFAHLVTPDVFKPAFMAGIEAMDSNRGGGPTNFETFTRALCSRIDISPSQLEKMIDGYFETEFPKFKYSAKPSVYARSIMSLSFESDIEVVIATGFQAPLGAAELRLGWAGVPASEYSYKFIATWNNMHASKPHPEFYEEILGHIDRKAEECLMIGDNWEGEIVPATKIGIPSWWIEKQGKEPPRGLALLMGIGQLQDLYEWLKNSIS
jgi:FMN phosphatase YigB (HAD superfamily)